MVSILSIPSTVSCSTSTPLRLTSTPFRPSIPYPVKFLKPRPFKYPYLKILVTSSSSSVEDVSADSFLKNPIADFARFKRGNGPGGSQLQTAIVTYRKKFPWLLLRPFLQVDLVSTIHIADKEYFATLQKELELYDCVLYEMVASREVLENRRNRAGEKKFKAGISITGCIQRLMARILTLDFQLECLDYDSEKWYHADLDLETFSLLQHEKGESLFTLAWDAALKTSKAMKIPSIPSIAEDLGPWRSKLLWASRVLPMPLVSSLIIEGVFADVKRNPKLELEALFRLDFGAAFKVFLAKQLTSDFSQMMADVDESSVLIGDRNRAAIEALRRAIDEGHNRIAILYGGGHMPDLGKRLRKEFDLSPSRVQWVTAWSIRNRELQSSSLPFLKTMAEVLGWPLNRYQTLALLIFSSVLALDLWFWELFFGAAVNWVSQIASEVVQYVDNAQVI